MMAHPTFTLDARQHTTHLPIYSFSTAHNPQPCDFFFYSLSHSLDLVDLWQLNFPFPFQPLQPQITGRCAITRNDALPHPSRPRPRSSFPPFTCQVPQPRGRRPEMRSPRRELGETRTVAVEAVLWFRMCVCFLLNFSFIFLFFSHASPHANSESPPLGTQRATRHTSRIGYRHTTPGHGPRSRCCPIYPRQDSSYKVVRRRKSFQFSPRRLFGRRPHHTHQSHLAHSWAPFPFTRMNRTSPPSALSDACLVLGITPPVPSPSLSRGSSSIEVSSADL
jgi:hypothetical protein